MTGCGTLQQVCSSWSSAGVVFGRARRGSAVSVAAQQEHVGLRSGWGGRRGVQLVWGVLQVGSCYSQQVGRELVRRARNSSKRGRVRCGWGRWVGQMCVSSWGGRRRSLLDWGVLDGSSWAGVTQGIQQRRSVPNSCRRGVRGCSCPALGCAGQQRTERCGVVAERRIRGRSALRAVCAHAAAGVRVVVMQGYGETAAARAALGGPWRTASTGAVLVARKAGRSSKERR